MYILCIANTSHRLHVEQCYAQYVCALCATAPDQLIWSDLIKMVLDLWLDLSQDSELVLTSGCLFLTTET